MNWLLAILSSANPLCLRENVHQHHSPPVDITAVKTINYRDDNSVYNCLGQCSTEQLFGNSDKWAWQAELCIHSFPRTAHLICQHENTCNDYSARTHNVIYNSSQMHYWYVIWYRVNHYDAEVEMPSGWESLKHTEWRWSELDKSAILLPPLPPPSPSTPSPSLSTTHWVDSPLLSSNSATSPSPSSDFLTCTEGRVDRTLFHSKHLFHNFPSTR